ncbi:hypothetical protein [Wielerella bovis]|uniref:hypothetical protein n=1 Tax=Wielerella bovis TaxID=2917790 RepID=UPI0020184D21|nr:hypothetical protein [Wielerella bovis]ULJ65493.1 hypothetical protein MIS33_04300 [Wielerella bovis]ULJ66463.1 hypothetical protein MIS31_09405 [Wielerella bovis]
MSKGYLFVRDLAAYSTAANANAENQLDMALNLIREVIKRTGSPENAILEIHRQMEEWFDPAFTSDSVESLMHQEEVKMNLVKAWQHYDKVKGTDYAFVFKYSTSESLCEPRSKKQIEKAKKFKTFCWYAIAFIIYAILFG